MARPDGPTGWPDRMARPDGPPHGRAAAAPDLTSHCRMRMSLKSRGRLGRLPYAIMKCPADRAIAK
eukprot:5020868-Pleurochrysis_carterae.AAC.1